MNLVFPGFARSGSTSLWEMFRHHPEVATSVEKEYLFDSIDRSNYIQNGFLTDENTKLLLDASPSLGLFKKAIEIIKTIKGIDKIYIIFVLRNVIDRLISWSTVATRTYLSGNARFPFSIMKEGKLNLHKLDLSFIRYSLEFCYLNRLEKELSIDKNDIIVVHLEEIQEKQKELQEALGLNHYGLKFKHLNTINEYNPTMEALFIKKEILDYMEKNSYKYEEIVLDQRKKISERYRVL